MATAGKKSPGKKSPGKKAPAAEKKQAGHGSVLAVVVVLMILFIPIGLCFVSVTPEPYTVIPTNPLPTAVQAAGASICSTTDTRWNVTGATGGKTYVISSNCAAQTSTNTIKVQIQAFDSVQSRDAAVQTYNTMSVGRGKPVGNLFEYNQYVIYVTPPNTNLMRSIQTQLKKMKGSQ
jgi:hypothetical protein